MFWKCFVLSLVIVLGGCSEKEVAIDLKPVTFNRWQQVLNSHQDKIVVVDAWATWCESCLEGFPKMVTLSEKYKNHGVQFISLNLDDRFSKTDRANALKFLVHVNARFPHYLMDENMMDAFERLNFMSLPVVLIYDKSGDEAFRFSIDNPNEQFTSEDVDGAIQTLLEL